jgi:hypothetical protein
VGIDTKLNNYLKITGIVYNTRKYKTQKSLKTKIIKLYNTLSLPAVLNGSKIWAIKSRDARIITAAEMKYT